ncbi:CHAP domain-containing protein [Hyalangium gracile]|uniref:CHAP domain-containing protein n=1 Tax=Hyalangium gracile TaxID=394092 RepID=UPI001CCA08C1|nr:CHAP domain-containing protein [Hyalangium gracile]
MIRSLLVVLAAFGVLTSGTARAQASSGRARAASRPASPAGRQIAARATQLVGVRSLRSVDASVPDDCSGLVRLAYEKAGIELMEGGGGRRGDNAVTYLYQRARRLGAVRRERPRPGDIAFFRETYDRNRDGRRNDGLTHVGIVERVEPDGQIILVHRGSKGVARTRMNLKHPTVHRQKRGGAVVNDYLRAASRKQRAYVTGELFAGFASPEPWIRARRAPPRR